MAGEQRLPVDDVEPAATEAVLALERYLRKRRFNPPPYEVVKIRAPKINGCAYCLDMHNRDAGRGRGPAPPRCALWRGVRLRACSATASEQR
jgi:AhpD family alkylhydroperoxidase